MKYVSDIVYFDKKTNFQKENKSSINLRILHSTDVVWLIQNHVRYLVVKEEFIIEKVLTLLFVKLTTIGR